MSREFLSALLMLLLIAGSALNIMAADRLCDKMLGCIDRAEAAAEEENWAGAEDNAQRALELWLGAKAYTHIFIRHSEIDICTDAFYELEEAILSKNTDEIKPVFAKLRYHINSIADMEKPTPGNIL